jgi:hypothetical protein
MRFGHCILGSHYIAWRIGKCSGAWTSGQKVNRTNSHVLHCFDLLESKRQSAPLVGSYLRRNALLEQSPCSHCLLKWNLTSREISGLPYLCWWKQCCTSPWTKVSFHVSRFNSSSHRSHQKESFSILHLVQGNKRRVVLQHNYLMIN